MERLSEDEINSELGQHTNWQRLDEKWIQRKYRFTDYLKGIDFVQKIASYSEEIQHHPFISIDYKLVTVKLSSWNAKGLTKLDFEMASRFDIIFEAAEK